MKGLNSFAWGLQSSQCSLLDVENGLNLAGGWVRDGGASVAEKIQICDVGCNIRTG